MPELFPCERCGHPLNRHDPCNDTVGAGKRAKPCTCPTFEPADLKDRVASLTDPVVRVPLARGGRA